MAYGSGLLSPSRLEYASTNSRPPGIDLRSSVATEHVNRLPSVVGMPFFFGLVKPDSQTPSGPYSFAFGTAAPTSLYSCTEPLAVTPLKTKQSAPAAFTFEAYAR